MKEDLVLPLTPRSCNCQKRSQLVKKLNDSDHQSSTSPLMEGTPTIKSKKKLLQIIDTTLLKCYLHVSCRSMPAPYPQTLEIFQGTLWVTSTTKSKVLDEGELVAFA